MVIPSDLSGKQGEQFEKKISSLTEEEQGLVKNYIILSSFGERFGGKGVAQGTTVGEAIEISRKWASEVRQSNERSDILESGAEDSYEAAMEAMQSLK